MGMEMGMGTVVCGDGWGWGQLVRGWMGTGTILKLLAGIWVGMGIRVTGTVGDGYKYLSPCSSLVRRSKFNVMVGPTCWKMHVLALLTQHLKNY